MAEKKTSRPKQPNIDSSGYRLYSTGEAAKLLNISIQTVRSWCASGRLISIRSPSNGKRAGNRYISESELQRIRSDNAFTTVNEAVNRMQAIIDDRDATIHDLINEKSHINSHNFEVVDKKFGARFASIEAKIDMLSKKLDRLDVVCAKPPAIKLSDKTIRHIAEVVLSGNGEHGATTPAPVEPTNDDHHQAPASQAHARGLSAHSRVVTQDERNRLIGELS